jgi:hypothetical protein
MPWLHGGWAIGTTQARLVRLRSLISQVPCSNIDMKRFARFASAGFLLALLPLAAQTAPGPTEAEDYSGMYTFLKDGEFVQLTVESGSRISGFVSRYGDLDSDRGAFLDQFFRQAKLDGNKLTFTTETVHGVWYDFKGTIERGEGKQSGDEAYYLLKGTLAENVIDSNKKTTSRARDVAFKLLPRDLEPAPPKRD